MKRHLVVLVAVLILSFVAGAVKLSMYVGDETMARVMKTVTEAYVKENPAVEFDIIALPYYGGFMQKVSLSIMSGDVPDLIQVTTAYAPQVKEYLLNLTPDIEKALGMTSKDYLSSIFDVTSVYMTQEDEIKLIPLEFTITGIWVNKDMFEKAGIKYPPTGGKDEPWTWEEFKDLLGKVKKANRIPYALSFDYSADRFFNYLALWNVKVLEDDTSFVLDKYPEAVKAIEEFIDLFKKNLVPKAEWLSGQSAQQDFFGGRTAAYWSGSWQCKNALDMMKETNKNFDVAYVPMMKDWFGVPGGSFLGAFKTGDKEKEAEAKKFITWLANKDKGYAVFLKEGLYLTAYKNHVVDYGIPEFNKWANEVFSKLGERSPVWTATTRANVIWSKLYDVVRKQLALGITGEVTAKEIVNNLKNEYEKIISETSK
ncbi:MAG: alpha,4-digalacturonate transport system substrate-binding protein [Thermotogaceae bacterium]|jgi:alpha-1,4-digalacturonate transport system substrate-binding protein|nr:alpha,4-digalacturonate transport system substrate-binding protein [Thermotogaceae bacterium]MDN5338059.1 alpha,4-digalacturonate transport system substrate-binding protein [Thermotogaceae bacterium]